jgi:hypothetical protein
MQGVKGIGKGVLNLVDTAGMAIEGTTELAKKTVDASLKVTGAAVDTASVLGTATLDAAKTLGKAGLGATSAIGESGLKATTALTTKTLDTAVDVGTAALDAATTVSTTALKTTSMTVEKTGQVLQAGVNAGATVIQNALNGIRNVSEITAGRGSLIAEKIKAQQAAEGKALDDIGRKQLIAKAAVEQFDTSTSSLKKGIREVIGVQKTTLAANINMYRGTQCGWWKRAFGRCKPEIAGDVVRAKVLSDRLFKFFDLETAKTRGLLTTGNTDPGVIVDTYMKGIDAAVEKFNTDFKTIIDKYAKLIDDALTNPPPAGGRRKSKASSQRTRRVVRGRRALRRATRKGTRGT